MPREKEGFMNTREQTLGLFPYTVSYLEHLEDEAALLVQRLEGAKSLEAMTRDELDALDAAKGQEHELQELLDELAAGNLSSVTAYCERTAHELFAQNELKGEELATTEKAGRALVELKAAQGKMLH